MKCWAHKYRKAVACGTFTGRGYCRACWPLDRLMPHGALTYIEVYFWPKPVPKDLGDAAIWLAA